MTWKGKGGREGGRRGREGGRRGREEGEEGREGGREGEKEGGREGEGKKEAYQNSGEARMVSKKWQKCVAILDLLTTDSPRYVLFIQLQQKTCMTLTEARSREASRTNRCYPLGKFSWCEQFR